MFFSQSIAHTLGASLKETLDAQHLIVGTDTRRSSDAIAHAVMAGALASGLDVTYAGVLSTPMLAFQTKKTKTTGVMVTASHNPHHDNGLKVFHLGDKLSAEQEDRLDACIDHPRQEAFGFGRFTVASDIMASYTDMFDALGISRSRMRVGYDTANGALSHVAPMLFNRYCEHASQINGHPDGLNINAGCGSTVLASIQGHVEKENLDLGFSFDGDGDRCLVVDASGSVYDGDMIVYAIAKHFKKLGRLKHETVVLTQMSNPGILKAFERLGISVVKTAVGDKHVAAEIEKNHYSLGGENSGHIILNDILHTGDGLLTAMVLLDVLSANATTLDSWTEEAVLYPQKTYNIKNASKAVLETAAFKELRERCRQKLGADGMLLVRPSGTEPVIRVTAANEDAALVDEVIDTLKRHIVNYKEEMPS